MRVTHYIGQKKFCDCCDQSKHAHMVLLFGDQNQNKLLFCTDCFQEFKESVKWLFS